MYKTILSLSLCVRLLRLISAVRKYKPRKRYSSVGYVGQIENCNRKVIPVCSHETVLEAMSGHRVMSLRFAITDTPIPWDCFHVIAIFSPRFGLRPVPVSYTHLDVYKRQILGIRI